MSIKDSLLSANQGRIQLAVTLETGEAIYVRSLSAGVNDRIESIVALAVTKGDAAKLSTAKARLVVASACHEDGTRIFDDSDLAAVQHMDCALLQRIYDAAKSINQQDWQDAEAAAKN